MSNIELWEEILRLLDLFHSFPEFVSQNPGVASFLDENKNNNHGKFIQFGQSLKAAFQNISPLRNQCEEILENLADLNAQIDDLSVFYSFDPKTITYDSSSVAQLWSLLLAKKLLKEEFSGLRSQIQASLNNDWAEAYSINASVNSTLPYEYNRKEVNRILLEKMRYGYLSESDAFIIRYIAAQGPDEGGKAVEIAASLLPWCEQSNLPWNAARNSTQSRLKGIKLNAQNAAHVEVTLNPNPATDMVWVRSTDEVDARWQILDAQGRIIKEGKMTGKIAEISLSKMPHGLYFFNIVTYPGSSFFHHKIVVHE